MKAYCTRVGNGPFPTELTNETGEKLRTIGHEFGATTGRPRRCGWFDVVAARYSAMINGIRTIAITKLDVLDHFDEIKVCIGYEYQGRRLKTFPTDIGSLQHITPVYETFPGWKTSLGEARSSSALPDDARRYIQALGQLCDTPVSLVSVGPRRDQTITME
jgi:adenylosuccinate synthase